MRLLIVLVLTSFFLLSKAVSIEKADSLFLNQKYTEAYYLYEEVFNTGKYSDAMLLKMAFIQDGSDNFAEALFFLNLYYSQTADRSVLIKIAELSEHHQLQGYAASDFNYFSILMSKYRGSLLLFSGGLTLLLFAFLLWRFANREVSIIGASMMMVMMVLTLFVNNYRASDEGIINQEGAWVMSGPSAAAEPVQWISKGHKVSILNKNELWTQVIWDGQQVFIRSQKIKPI